jgi:hypothetical protein
VRVSIAGGVDFVGEFGVECDCGGGGVVDIKEVGATEFCSAGGLDAEAELGYNKVMIDDDIIYRFV